MPKQAGIQRARTKRTGVGQSDRVFSPVNQFDETGAHCVTTCLTCTEEIITNQPTVRCVTTCFKDCHLTCLEASYKQKCGIPIKNGIERLAEFIEQTHFKFLSEICAMSTQLVKMAASTLTDNVLVTRVHDLNNQVFNVCKNVAKMNKMLSLLVDASFFLQSSSISSHENNPASAATSATSVSALCASVLYKDVKATIKSVIAENIRADTDCCSIAVYRFPESEYDYDDLYDMHSFKGCTRIEIIRHMRIGRFRKSK